MKRLIELRIKYAIMTVWNAETGSNSEYITRMVEKADADDAPFNAIYYCNHKKVWRLLSDCNEENREGFQLRLANKALELVHTLMSQNGGQS